MRGLASVGVWILQIGSIRFSNKAYLFVMGNVSLFCMMISRIAVTSYNLIMSVNTACVLLFI